MFLPMIGPSKPLTAAHKSVSSGGWVGSEDIIVHAGVSVPIRTGALRMSLIATRLSAWELGLGGRTRM